MVEVDADKIVDVGVDLVILVADLLRREAFSKSLDFSGGAIFVSSAHVNGIVPTQSRVSCVDISAQNCPDQVA